MDTMSQVVSGMKNVCITKSWIDICGRDVVSNLPIMYVMNQEINVERIELQKLKEYER